MSLRQIFIGVILAPFDLDWRRWQLLDQSLKTAILFANLRWIPGLLTMKNKLLLLIIFQYLD
ncbi:MAG: hypothetical protein OFPI_06010 [Osedax symbiont Rs2]|nr:MAG: hypothetical protein OFPI_06010 [Osedax symbiont Rs2]